MSHNIELDHVKKNKVNFRKALLIIFVISLTIRLLFGVLIFKNEGTKNFCDDWDYISYAKGIISQGVFVPDIIKLNEGMHTEYGVKGGGASVIGPGFPLIIAGLFSLFGENYLPVILLNALISAFLCVLIFYIGRELFNERVAVFASVWSVFYILHIRYIPTVLKEVLLAFIFPLIIYLFILETKRRFIFWKSLLLPIIYAFIKNCQNGKRSRLKFVLFNMKFLRGVYIVCFHQKYIRRQFTP